MKYLKLLAICLLPLSFVACSDDDDNINTGEATVAFQSASMEIKESTSVKSEKAHEGYEAGTWTYRRFPEGSKDQLRRRIHGIRRTQQDDRPGKRLIA